MDKINFFEISIYTGDILDFDKDYWINIFYEHKSNNFSAHKSNVGGYQSENTLHLNKTYFPLVKICDKLISNITEDPNIKLTDLWFNINHPTTFNKIHDHGPFMGPNPPSISGVLYLKVPSNSGNIIFYNPLNINHNQEFLTPENRYFLFPRWLPHSVNPNLSEEDRISLAFNYNFIF
jgi:uncharacterized protein (TIGR02466 family)